MSTLLDSLLAGFDVSQTHAGLPAARKAAFDALLVDGLPGPRSEAWKYTSLRALERRSFAPVAEAPCNEDIGAVELPPAPRLVFVDGRYSARHSDSTGLPEGVTLRPLSQELALGDERAVAFLERRFTHRDEVFARINTVLAGEGAVLRAGDGVVAHRPVHLVFVGAAGVDRAWHLRHLIELRHGARLTLVEHRLHHGDHAHLANELAHVHLARGACLTHLRVQADADGATSMLRTDAVLAGDSVYRRTDLELGAALSRHELNVSLQGQGARVSANGVLLASGQRHVDTRLGIEHVARDTTCELVWRGLGAGRGRTVFHGGILIREGADGSEAMLANKNLLLSEGAEIDTQPVLEIHADEVKAAHGATVGRLDERSLFYLRSRGLPLAQARSMLTAAFCREVLGLMFEDAGAGAAAPSGDATPTETTLTETTPTDTTLLDARLIEAAGAHLDAALARMDIGA